MPPLTQEQFDHLHQALLDAFDPFTLEIFVRTKVSPRPLAYYVPTSATVNFQTFKLVEAAEANSFTLELIAAAREARPRNPEFVALAAELGIASTSAPQLERLVRAKQRMHDIAIIRSRLGEIEGRVCRIEITAKKEGNDVEVTGTGFLVGSDAVMTNYHVVEPLVQEIDGMSADAANVVVRFDYKVLPGKGVFNRGTTYKLAPNWLIDSAPYPKDMNAPKADELDYAIIRTDRKAGDEMVGGWPGSVGTQRGFMTLDATPRTFATDDPIAIAQHPGDAPMKFVSNTQSVISVNGDHTQLKHRTNTEEGSSGSPCFDDELLLVALHHAGDPAWWRPAGFNLAIPISAVAARIAARGVKV